MYFQNDKISQANECNLKIEFNKKQLKDCLQSEVLTKREYGTRIAKSITLRLKSLSECNSLADVPTEKPDRCHELKGKRKNHFAVNLDKGRRLIFKVGHDPIPRKEDGGIDKSEVFEIVVVEISDHYK